MAATGAVVEAAAPNRLAGPALAPLLPKPPEEVVEPKRPAGVGAGAVVGAAEPNRLVDCTAGTEPRLNPEVVPDGCGFA